MSELYDVLVIGAGAAGMTSAMYASRAGLKVALVERGLYGGAITQTNEIENYTGFTTISGSELAESMENQVRAQENVKHIYGDVLGVQGNRDNTYTAKLRKGYINAKSVIIATGVSHKKLGVAGEYEYSGVGVSYCATCDGNFFKGKDVVVIGGGDSALEEGAYLADIVKSVTLIYHKGKESLKAEKLLQDRFFSKENTSMIEYAHTTEIHGENGQVIGVEYRDKYGEEQYQPTDGVFIYVGVEPISEPFADFVSRTEGYIHSFGSNLETSRTGVFVAGDIRYGSVRQVTTAVGDGTIAAISAYKHVQKFNKTY